MEKGTFNAYYRTLFKIIYSLEDLEEKEGVKMIKKIVLLGVCLLVLLSFAACSPVSPTVDRQETPEALSNDTNETESEEPRIFPSVVVHPAALLLSEKTEVIIAGAGFPPNQEITLITLEVTNVRTDVTVFWGLTEEELEKGATLLTDEYGTFIVESPLKRLARVLEPGVYPLWVKVDDVEVVVPLVYYDEQDEEEV